MTRFFLGIDIGGTKSHALIADETGRALGFGTGGAGNHQIVGYAGFEATLQKIVSHALASAGLTLKQISGAGFGVSGYDWPSDREPILRTIRSLGLDGPVEVVNDAIIGLLAGSTSRWGVAVVAGTSSNCRGWDRQRKEGRVCGMGHRFGEFGGASELVMKAVQGVVAAWAHRGPPTELTATFIELTGARDAFDLVEGLTLGRYKLEHNFAPVIFEVANRGDAVARETIAWAGRELGSLAVGVIRQLSLEDLEFDVILVGGLYKGGAMLIEPMRDTIQAVAPRARLVRLTTLPVVGGVLLGMERTGLERPTIRGRLIDTSNSFISRDQKVSLA